VAGVQLFRFGNVAVADPPGSNTSKSEELDSSLVPKDTLYLKIYASVLTSKHLVSITHKFCFAVSKTSLSANFIRTEETLE
jgi:hypothetical protein